MTDIVFSFDTEDFTSSESADAIYTEAEILRKAGIRGCFCMVGLLCEQLVKWNRTDVIEALSHHEIDLHSYGHSLHPTINEYTDTEDFNRAYERVFANETKAAKLIRDVFKTDKIYAAVPPGNNKSYAAMYAYHKMGIPIYADTFCAAKDGQGTYYCNEFHMDYNFEMESMFFKCGEEDIVKTLDKLAEKKRVVAFTHPHISLYSKHWDEVNYFKKNIYPFGQWQECPKRTKEETENFYKNMQLFAKLVKEDGRFRIVTYKDIYNQLLSEGKRTVHRGDIIQIERELGNNFYPISTPVSLSLADIFLACRSFILGSDEHICKDVYGFLHEPFAIEKSLSLKAEDIVKSAQEIKPDGFLPEKISVGDNTVGPADWMRATLQILCGSKIAQISPGEKMPSLDMLPDVRDCSFTDFKAFKHGKWATQSDDFKDQFLSDRLRLQAWTMRFVF